MKLATSGPGGRDWELEDKGRPGDDFSLYILSSSWTFTMWMNYFFKICSHLSNTIDSDSHSSVDYRKMTIEKNPEDSNKSSLMITIWKLHQCRPGLEGKQHCVLQLQNLGAFFSFSLKWIARLYIYSVSWINNVNMAFKWGNIVISPSVTHTCREA